VNKYLHTVASVGFLFTLSYDAYYFKFIVASHYFLKRIRVKFDIYFLDVLKDTKHIIIHYVVGIRATVRGNVLQPSAISVYLCEVLSLFFQPYVQMELLTITITSCKVNFATHLIHNILIKF